MCALCRPPVASLGVASLQLCLLFAGVAQAGYQTNQLQSVFVYVCVCECGPSLVVALY